MRWLRKVVIVVLAAVLATGIAVVAMAASDVGPLSRTEGKLSNQGGASDDTAGERFDRFLGAQFTYRDEEGNPITVIIDAGSLQSLGEDQLVLTLNSGEPKTFALTDNTRIPRREGLEEGDKLIVVSHAGSDEARLVLRGGALRLLGRLPLLDLYPESVFHKDRLSPRERDFRWWRYH